MVYPGWMEEKGRKEMKVSLDDLEYRDQQDHQENTILILGIKGTLDHTDRREIMVRICIHNKILK